MNRTYAHCQGSALVHQKGFALVLLLMLFGAGIGAALFSFYSSTTLILDSDQRTADVLARAKEALIGRAVRDDNRPGSFPCPDAVTNIPGNVPNDGIADLLSGNECPSYLGRLPWRTLGLPDLRDASGERLWYALSRNFRDDDSAQPINSDTRGNITVYAADGSTLLADGSTNQNPKAAVAVIFAPGQALGSQTRDSANQNIAANYLEASAGINNAATNGPFIVGRVRDPANPNYNDRVISITTPEFIPAVEMRVASELKTVLQAYYDTNGYFPFAAAYDDTSGNCASNLRRGRVPSSITAAPNPPNDTCAGLAEWTPPIWFRPNQWYRVIYYSVAAGYVYLGPGACAGGLCLTVDSNASVPALFFTPGTPRVAIIRPSMNLADYLENVPNQDGWGAGPNDIYVTPTATTRDRDRVFMLAGGPSSSQCANNAAQLLALVPCGQPPRLNPQCVTLATNLQVCTCAAAANEMITTPCENNLKPPVCQAAVATLKACNS